jgi:hypothetical protein
MLCRPIPLELKDDGFDYRLERDPRFLARIEASRQSLRAEKGVRLEEVGE